MTKDDRAPTVIALIPARAGSKRVVDKNIGRIAGHPAIAYTIEAAVQSGIFASVLVSTDSDLYAGIARYYGAEVPFLRPVEFAGDLSPDIEWVGYTLRRLREEGNSYHCFSILRPTSPLRQAETIRRAWQEFLSQEGLDSLRAVERCSQHPGKMWVLRGHRMVPLLPLSPPEQPWHSSQYQSLPEVYVQNASLEIAWCRIVFDDQSIAGNVVMPFLTRDLEGFDINDPEDWLVLNNLIESGQAILPQISKPPFQEIRPATLDKA
jgi:CMP-N,N'-diacetyllegionaminic acid synthase